MSSLAKRWHDQVVGVIAAREENTNQSLVIGDVRLRQCRIHETEVTNRGSDGGSAYGGAGGTANEITAGYDVDVLFLHKLIFRS